MKDRSAKAGIDSPGSYEMYIKPFSKFSKRVAAVISLQKAWKDTFEAHKDNSAYQGS